METTYVSSKIYQLPYTLKPWLLSIYTNRMTVFQSTQGFQSPQVPLQAFFTISAKLGFLGPYSDNRQPYHKEATISWKVST